MDATALSLLLLLNLGCFMFRSSRKKPQRLSAVSPSTPPPASPPPPKRAHGARGRALAEVGEGRDVVRIIFQSGWGGKAPEIERVLRVQNSRRTLAGFEEQRRAVRARAAARAAAEERCMADGNERLRFCCTTYLCGLAGGGGTIVDTCGSPLCGTCEVVRNGFTSKAKAGGGVRTHATGSAAHAALLRGLEEDLPFLHVRRAMLVCRVLAGRAARAGADVLAGPDDDYDSVVVGGEREEEMVVVDPRGVLPCFVVIYKVVT